MMQSSIIQAIDPSFNKQPMLNTQNYAEQQESNTLYDRVTKHDINTSMNMNFVSDLREWAAGLSNEFSVNDSD